MTYDMRNSLALVIDSTSNYSDVWIPYFGELNKFFPNEIKKYLFTDEYIELEYDNITPIYYHNDDSYRNQYLGCLKEVKEKYMIYNSEDYILYDNVNMDEIYNLMNILENDSTYDFIKFIKGPEKTIKYSENYPNLYIIDKSFNFFAQQASLWRTKSLIKIFENSKPENGRMQQEPLGSEVCKRIGIDGLQYHTGKEIKRGRQHWDSTIFPCITTAVTKGKWNVEYFLELNKLFIKYNIDVNIRGWING